MLGRFLDRFESCYSRKSTRYNCNS